MLQDLIPQEGLAPERGARGAGIYLRLAENRWEVGLFSSAGKKQMSGCLAQLRAELVGGFALTGGTCASLCPYLSAKRLGVLPASNTHHKPSLAPQPRTRDCRYGKGLLLPLFS